MKTTIIRTAQTHPGAPVREIAVSLPAVPDIEITDDRHETAPRCRIVTPEHRLSPDEVVDIIRREWVRARVEA